MSSVIVPIEKLNDDDLYSLFEHLDYQTCAMAAKCCHKWKFISNFFLKQKELEKRIKLIHSVIKADKKKTKEYRGSGKVFLNAGINYKHAKVIKEFWNKKKTILVFSSMEGKLAFLNLALNILNIPRTDVSIVSCVEQCTAERLSASILLCTHCVESHIFKTSAIQRDIFLCFNGDVNHTTSVGYEFVLEKGWKAFKCF